MGCIRVVPRHSLGALKSAGLAVLTLGVAQLHAANVVVDHTNWNWYVSQSDAVVARVASIKVFFAHASVGSNIVSGLASLHSSTPARYPLVTVGEDGAPPTQTTAGTFYEYARGNPGWASKIALFSQYMGNGWGTSKVDVAMDKFCYIDQGANWQTYRDTMLSLEGRYTGTAFVYWTMPLMATTDNDEVLRATHNRNLRNWIAGQDGKVLFDIADIEAWDVGANHHTFVRGVDTCEQMDSAYCADCTGGAHLNAVGQVRIATAVYSLLGRMTETPTTVSPQQARPRVRAPGLTYTLDSRSTVCVSLFDLGGRMVWSFRSGSQNAGEYEVAIPRGAIPAGNYVLRGNAGRTQWNSVVSVVR
jgi:hypothetical protein